MVTSTACFTLNAIFRRYLIQIESVPPEDKIPPEDRVQRKTGFRGHNETVNAKSVDLIIGITSSDQVIEPSLLQKLQVARSCNQQLNILLVARCTSI